MANSITKHIPNTITCMNLFCGCVATYHGFMQQFEWALVFIILGAVFDFFDGLAARQLNAYSIIGKDIDSLADDITFGIAPASMVFSWLQLWLQIYFPVSVFITFIPYLAFLIAVFSALRLAKFNNDTRQTSSFIGLPVPANALFWASIIVGGDEKLMYFSITPLLIIVCIFISCWLLVSEIPMFSLKFKNLSWQENKVRFIFLFGCLLLLACFEILGIALIIIWFILLSLITQRKAS
jgi:CDP-diacylglycerol--serine O-phosphatidyltransferase